MIENIRVNVLGQTIEVSKGTTLLEISKAYQDKFKYQILVASVNGIYQELTETVEKNSEIEFFDLTNSFANKMYLNALIYLTMFASRELFGPSINFRVLHSIDKGLYIESKTALTEENILALETKMQNIVKREMSFTKLNVTRIDAINYFKSIGDTSKVEIMKYNTNTYVTLYKLGNMYSYFYSLMPVNTECLSEFALTYLDEYGFVLRFPTIYMKDGIKEYQHRPKIFEVFKEYREWESVMHLDSVGQLNERVSSGTISDLIRIDETLQNGRLLSVARDIENAREDKKIILIAGPSSSGKTTTCRKLAMYLRSFGMNPVMISMDDYFVNRDETPVDEDGNPDYESLDTVDLALFDKQMSSLLKGEEVTIPTYNFIFGVKEFKKKLKLGTKDILMIEGIHGLNPNILTNIEAKKKYKIYLSALTSLNLDLWNRISTTDNRLLRRIIRDNRTRGYSVDKTLAAWSKVRKGEEKYIFPYQDDADFTFNTALIYELGVLKTYVEPLLYSVPTSSPYYEEAKRLINILKMFLPIPSEDIPADSIIREFIGHSCFQD
ncbi:MAG: nucleoside kinase [Bacilli bacterium]